MVLAMDKTGILTAEKGASGWRWTYTSPGGASYLGPNRHKTKKEAEQAGQAWLASR